MSDAVVSINLRLPRELHERLKELAESDRRSLNAEIVYLLEQTPARSLSREIN
jgi:hypothetical protein